MADSDDAAPSSPGAVSTPTSSSANKKKRSFKDESSSDDSDSASDMPDILPSMVKIRSGHHGNTGNSNGGCTAFGLNGGNTPRLNTVSLQRGAKIAKKASKQDLVRQQEQAKWLRISGNSRKSQLSPLPQPTPSPTVIAAAANKNRAAMAAATAANAATTTTAVRSIPKKKKVPFTVVSTSVTKSGNVITLRRPPAAPLTASLIPAHIGASHDTPMVIDGDNSQVYADLTARVLFLLLLTNDCMLIARDTT